MRVKRLRKLFVSIALVTVLLATAACEGTPPDQTDVPTVTPAAEVTDAPTVAQHTAAAATTGPTSAPTVGATNSPGATPTIIPSSTPTNPPDVGATNPPDVTATPNQDATNLNPTPKPVSPTSTPAGGLRVVSTATYKDAVGNFHVVGEIQNGGTKILTDMQLAVVIKDATGNSLLKDRNDQVVDSLPFNPTLANLAPGEFSPFDYYLDAGAGAPDEKSVLVTVSGQDVSAITRADFEIRSAQMKPNGPDSFYVTGEIANKTNKPIAIRSLAVGLVDKDKKVIATDYSVDYTVYLQASGDQYRRDVTPFYLRIDNPGVNPVDWKTYVDAEVVDEPDNYAVIVNITNNYFDDVGNFHIVGTLANDSSDVLTTQIVAGLYDKDGVVLDAYSSFSPVSIAPKEVIPYDISAFSNFNGNSEEASRLDRWTVQIDDYFTFPSSIETVILQFTNEGIDKVNNQWTIKGKATNNSKKALSSENVMVSVYDQDGKLMADNYDWITTSGDSIGVGDINSFTVEVRLDPDADTTNYTYKIKVKGEVK